MCKDVSSFADFISGCTVAKFHSGRKIPCVIERFTILVNVSSIETINIRRNLLLHGSICQVVGFMDFIVNSKSLVDTGLNLLEDAHCDFGGA